MKYLIGYPVMMVICYLTFSFVTLSFDFSNWTENYRILCVIFSVVWGTALSYRISQDCKWAY